MATPSDHGPTTHVCVAPLCPGLGARSMPADGAWAPILRWYVLCSILEEEGYRLGRWRPAAAFHASGRGTIEACDPATAKILVIMALGTAMPHQKRRSALATRRSTGMLRLAETVVETNIHHPPTARCSMIACPCSAGHWPKPSGAPSTFCPGAQCLAGSHAPCQAPDEKDHGRDTAARHGDRRPVADRLSAQARPGQNMTGA